MLLEEKLPIDYFSNNLVEASVMTAVFDEMFTTLDEKVRKTLDFIPSKVFQRHFTTLFGEINPSLSLAVLDLIFIFGSGTTRGTFQSEQEPVNRTYPLCRSQQLLLCLALALTRQIITKHRIAQQEV